MIGQGKASTTEQHSETAVLHKRCLGPQHV